MLAKPTLLMIIPNYGYGGAQRVFSNLVTGLSDQYEVIEVVFNNDEPDIYQGTGVKTSLNIAAGTSFFSKAINFLKRCRALNRIKVKHQCVASISHLEGANFINILSFGPGKKILCVHGSKTAEDSNRRGLIKFIENKIFTPILYNWADKVVAVSKGIAEELHDFFNISRSKLQVIQNGVDIERINTLMQEELPPHHTTIFNKKVLVYSGRLAAQKNPKAVIDIHKLAIAKAEYNLLIIGDGHLKDEMLEKCRQEKLAFYDEANTQQTESQPGIYFIGFQNNPFKYLYRSTLFILTSDFEGFPLAPCEAMACGLPVIATDCPTGVREILSASNQYKPVALKQAEFVEYGVLMPLLSAKQNNAAALWADTVVNVLNDDKSLSSYKFAGQRRATDLSNANFIAAWQKLLTLSVK